MTGPAGVGDVTSGNVISGVLDIVRSGDGPNASKVWVKGYVFERDAAKVAVGQPARVTFSAFPDLEAIGKVVRIAPMMDDNERVLPVWVEVDNPDRLLKEGMLARVAVLADSAAAGGKATETAQLQRIEPRR